MLKGIACKSMLMGALLLLGGVAAYAHNAVKLTQDDSTETVFLLGSHPKVTMEDSSLVITTDDDNVKVAIGNGAKFEFINHGSTAMESLQDAATFHITGDTLEAFNLTPGANVMIADMAGKIICSGVTDNRGNAVLSISNLPSGIYIFNSKDKNFKFYKK